MYTAGTGLYVLKTRTRSARIASALRWQGPINHDMLSEIEGNDGKGSIIMEAMSFAAANTPCSALYKEKGIQYRYTFCNSTICSPCRYLAQHDAMPYGCTGTW